jgi:hypothetical protein
MRRLLILVPVAAVLVVGCGGAKSEADQVRAAALGFKDSVKNDDGKCLSFVREEDRGMILTFTGGCHGLHEYYTSMQSDGQTNRYKAKDSKVVITGSKAVLTPPKASGDEPMTLVKEHGGWKLVIDEEA